MIPIVLLQADGLTETQRAVRDTLQSGGSVTLFLGVLGLLVASVMLTHWLTRRTSSSYQDLKVDHKGLFRLLQKQLGLTRVQRRLLDTMVRAHGVRCPSVLLLSSTLFDQYVESAWPKWESSSRSRDEFDQLVGGTRELLFR